MSDEKVTLWQKLAKEKKLQLLNDDFHACDALLCDGSSREDFIKENIDRIDTWKDAAEAGDPFGQLLYGLCYFYGYGLEEDEEIAVQWFLKSAEQGNAQAQCSLGLCYQQGFGVESDPSIANDWFVKAMAQGHKLACREVVLAELDGDIEALHSIQSKLESSLQQAQDEDEVSGSVDLRQLQHLTPEVAHQLSRAGCESIDLSGLQDLNLQTASSLAHCSAGLLLDGLQELTDGLAAILSHYKGPFISLNGLRDLSAPAADILSHYDGTLYLQKLDYADTLNVGLARLIFCRPSDDGEGLYCKTFVPGWSNSYEVDSDEYESQEKEDELENEDKNGAKLALNISLAAANVLVEELRTIDLPITSLTAEVANALARHQGWLILDQLTEIDGTTVDALAGHTGSLSLNGLTHLTDEAAAALANYQGECLSLTGLNELSDVAATSLSEFPERLCLQSDLTLSNESLREKLKEQSFWENIECNGNEFKPISS